MLIVTQSQQRFPSSFLRRLLPERLLEYPERLLDLDPDRRDEPVRKPDDPRVRDLERLLERLLDFAARKASKPLRELRREPLLRLLDRRFGIIAAANLNYN